MAAIQLDENTFLGVLKRSRDYIFVPEWFVKVHPQLIEEVEVEFKDPVGNVFQADLGFFGKHPRYGGCFNEIRQIYELESYVHIFFTRKGEMNYDIRIFDEQDFEVQYKLENEQQNIVAEDEALWSSTLTNALCQGGQTLSIPVSIVNEHFRHRPKSVNMLLPSGETDQWTMKWDSKRRRQCVFGDGWYKCCKDNEFHYRDQLKFYKLEEEDTFEVKIFPSA